MGHDTIVARAVTSGRFRLCKGWFELILIVYIPFYFIIVFKVRHNGSKWIFFYFSLTTDITHNSNILSITIL